MNSVFKQKKFKSQWLGKTITGLVLGLGLSFALVGLFAWIGADSLSQSLSNERLLWRTQFSMWLITPIWLLIFSFVYMFNSAKQAVLWLGSATLVVFIMLIVARGIS
ncbi:hypothetical protein [Pseudoalteromonas sp. S16_S37]|uniref:hypothetical protein n=1 Tax=Pseudoalteromonas sp. S16_S37 TaxID=2720228 RepID=UPI00167FE833|nr:hypothetical protein [Pseudoalteromonas sp. S16_S37]MBD1583726.1 hypothetical protein [Pseudoalteromonas sp. S16_S37]